MIGSTILETLLWGLQVQQWIVIAIILATFLVLMFSKVRPDMVFVCTIMALNITGVLSVEDSFSGLANSSVVVVGIMCGVIAGLKYTGALGWMVNTLMGRPKTHGGAIVKMMVPAAFLSAFTSNTATTLLFEGAVKSWARELRLAPSKLLIPLAYAASIGGMLTMLGSPCNLINSRAVPASYRREYESVRPISSSNMLSCVRDRRCSALQKPSTHTQTVRKKE